MSGGSYDYLYSRAPGELASIADRLADMADRCTGETTPDVLGSADDAALRECGAYLRRLSLQVKGMAVTLEKWERVTHDIEWWASGDSGPKDVVDSFAKLKSEVSNG